MSSARKTSSAAAGGTPREERPYDIIVYGASGFTGRLVAEYLSGSNGRTAFVGEQGKKLRWALGGRSAAKLQQVKAQLRVNSALADEPAIELADSDDTPALQRLTSRTRVVLSTVGPFARYGEPLVAAAVKTGTDYVDITGESPWVADMIAKYGEQAARTGALIVNMCGYDSIPSDLGAFLAADYLRTKHQVQAGHMQGYASTNGSPSGGTIATVLYMQEQQRGMSSNVSSIYLLNPADKQPARTRQPEKEQLFPRFHADTGAYSVPFVMGLVNTRVVRRSLALRRQLERQSDGFGPDASYNECMRVPSLFAAFLTWVGLVIFGAMLLTSPTRALLKLLLPKAGEGPSAERRARSTFAHRVVARGWSEKDDGRAPGQRAQDIVVQATIKGGDPGYTETSKMISQMALMLAHQRAELPLQSLVAGVTAVQGPVGGFYTPSVTGGHLLEQRLKHAGLTIEVADFTPKDANKRSKNE